MLNKDRNIYTIIGPTAIGKSKIAIDLVEKYPFEIISLDSSMIFREMNIGTDKPDSRILSKYKHHLIDIINPNIITKRKGGQGAFREFIDTILNSHPLDIFINNLLK